MKLAVVKILTFASVYFGVSLAKAEKHRTSVEREIVMNILALCVFTTFRRSRQSVGHLIVDTDIPADSARQGTLFWSGLRVASC